MPELPEVETVCRGLRRALKGTSITRVVLRRKNLRTAFPAGFAKALQGKDILSIKRRAKYILIHLSGDLVLITHLGMTGRFSVEQPPKKYAKHDHVIFHLNDGRVAIYNDARRFGLMELCDASEIKQHRLLSHLGPEPLTRVFSPEYLAGALSKRSAPIKPVLMDQELVVGVGNIYASEALFLTGISPLVKASEVANRAPELVEAIRQVLKSAIASGGSSLQDFVQVSGEAGYFQHQFKVYGRRGKPCFTCGVPLESIQQAGRSSFYCPYCQK